MSSNIENLLRKIRTKTQYTEYTNEVELKSMLDDIRRLTKEFEQNDQN